MALPVVPEALLDRSERFAGRMLRLTVDTVRLGDGRSAVREVVHHPGGVAAVAVDAAGRVLLVRQYRHPAEDILWELPAGTREPAEAPEATVRRELTEETGYAAGTWRALGAAFLAPGYSTELLYFYLATDLRRVGEATPDADEAVEAHFFDPGELARLVAEGGLRDAKTLAGLALAGLPVAVTPVAPA